ncbi:MAG TPA: DUF6600 domain-containing protein, partial [Planctomycetota bacterium]|nr:DUF6600 domain-containing protein [Planctomycetota bacterium]
MKLRLLYASLTALFFISASPLRADMYDIVDMAKSGVSAEVMTAYVENNDETYDLSASDVTYLYDVGVPDAVIVAMLQRPAPISEVALVQAKEPIRDYSSLAAPAAGEEGDYSTFYTSLAPYGNWIRSDAYGDVWQPYHTTIDTNWAPYRDAGRWQFVTDVGWTWDSDYSWGWAPFHYGRWTYLPEHKWCWVPGVHWSPAWVTWSYTDEYTGWAPLPPEA